jgi:hypothetical protein
MKSKFFILFIFFLGGIFIFIFANKNQSHSLVSPNASSPKTSASPSPTASPSVEEFNFNSSTDLKQTLNSVNPKIEDKKIDDLKQIIKSL